jgi:hypothetical protein
LIGGAGRVMGADYTGVRSSVIWQTSVGGTFGPSVLSQHTHTTLPPATQMNRDPAKRITGIATGRYAGAFRVLLIVDDQGLVLADGEAPDRTQAEMLANGYMDGFEGSEEIPPELLAGLVVDSQILADLEFPAEISLVNRELLRFGALGGLRLAAQGYWVDHATAGNRHSIH